MSKQNVFVSFTPQSTVQALAQIVAQALQAGSKSILILAADGNDSRPETIDPFLLAQTVPISGGVFPQVIHQQENHEYGFVVIGFPVLATVFNVPQLSDPEANYAEMIAEHFPDDLRPKSMLTIVDGMSSRIGSFLDGVYDVFGSEPVYFGGGAGSLSFKQKPCIFSNQGLLVDCAQLTLLPLDFQLGVEHGWQKFAGPFVVTSSDRNEVQSIDFRPAFSVYRELVEAQSGRQFDDTNFFDIAKGYPFGMERPDGSIVVRDPITHAADNMICVGEVPENSVVYLLKGGAEQLIEAAAEGAARLRPGTDVTLLFDCISRVLFLEDRFVEELVAVKHSIGDRPMVGVLSLGEIANAGGYCLEFFNKTLVLAALD